MGCIESARDPDEKDLVGYGVANCIPGSPTFRPVPIEILIQLWLEWIEFKIPVANRSVIELRAGVGTAFLRPSATGAPVSGLNFNTGSGQPDPSLEKTLDDTSNATLYFDVEKWGFDYFVKKVLKGDLNTDDIRSFRRHVEKQFEPDQLPPKTELACYVKKKVIRPPVVLDFEVYFEQYAKAAAKGVMKSKTLTNPQKKSLVSYAIDHELCAGIKLKEEAEDVIATEVASEAPHRSLQWLVTDATKFATKKVVKGQKAIAAYQKKVAAGELPDPTLMDSHLDTNQSMETISIIESHADGGVPGGSDKENGTNQNQEDKQEDAVEEDDDDEDDDEDDDDKKRKGGRISSDRNKKKKKKKEAAASPDVQSHSSSRGRALTPSQKAKDAAEGLR